MEKVDHTTWCEPDNKAGIYLADTLTRIGDPKLIRNVGTYIHKFYVRIHSLNSLDKENRVFYTQILLNETKKEIRKNFTSKSKLVATLLENLIVSVYRKELLKINTKKNKK